MHYLLRTIFTTILLCCLTISYAQTEAEKIDELMKAYNKLGQFNGTVLVARNGKVIYKKGFGFANMQWQIPNTPDTRFLLASVSKQFTAMLILQLVHKGVVSIEATISDYLNYYPVQTGARITIHQLLTHTSGIPDISNLPDFDEKYAHKHMNTKALINSFSPLPLDFEPGSRFGYSNAGYAVLAAIIEQVTGKTYAAVLKEQITIPLKMYNTGYAASNEVVSHYASGYRWAPLDGYIKAAYFDNSLSLGAGGIYSTADDLYKWDQALYTNQLIPNSLKQKMFTPYIKNYGYGFYVYNWENPGTKDTLVFAEHGGANEGFITLLFRSLKDRNSIILLSNTNEAQPNYIKNRIRSILYNRPYDLPEPELKNIVANVLRNKGMDAAKKEYQKLKESKLEEYGEGDFTYEFSQLGYGLLLSDHLNEAIEIYKLNTQAFPSSAKALDDLGEAYMIKGDKAAAIACYTKAAALQPDNVRIKTILEKLNAAQTQQ